MSVKLPKSVIGRLPAYYEYLKKLDAEKNVNVSSASIACALGLGEVLVRKDLAMISGGGKPRIGYNTERLTHEIGAILCGKSISNAIIVGAGKLGLALSSYEGFAEYSINISAIFDIDRKKVESLHTAVPVLITDKLQSFCKAENAQAAIIAVPADQAQKVCDLLTECGVSIIMNFAPTVVRTTQNVRVKNVNLAAELAALTIR